MRTRLVVPAILSITLLAPLTYADAGFTIGQNFVAADRGDVQVLNNNNFTRSPAPDVNGGVGPDQVVLFIKGVYRVFDKQTGYNPQPSVHSSAFGEPRHFFDPRRFQLAARLRF